MATVAQCKGAWQAGVLLLPVLRHFLGTMLAGLGRALLLCAYKAATKQVVH